VSFRDEICPYTTPSTTERRDWRLEGAGVHVAGWGYQYNCQYAPVKAQTQSLVCIALPKLTGEARFFNSATLWVYANQRWTTNPMGYAITMATNNFTAWTEHPIAFWDMVTYLAHGQGSENQEHQCYEYNTSALAPISQWLSFPVSGSFINGYGQLEYTGIKRYYEDNGYYQTYCCLQFSIGYAPGRHVYTNNYQFDIEMDPPLGHFKANYNFNVDPDGRKGHLYNSLGKSQNLAGLQVTSFDYYGDPDLRAFIHFSYEPQDPPPLPPVDPPRRGGPVRSIEELIADTTIHIGQLGHAKRILSTAKQQRNAMYKNEDSPASVRTNMLMYQSNVKHVVNQVSMDLKALNFQHQIVSKCLPEQLLRVETGKAPPAGSTMTKYLDGRYYMLHVSMFQCDGIVEMGWSISYAGVHHLRHYGAADSGHLADATGWDDFRSGDVVRVETSAVYPDGRPVSGTYRIEYPVQGGQFQGASMKFVTPNGTQTDQRIVYTPDFVMTLLERAPVGDVPEEP